MQIRELMERLAEFPPHWSVKIAVPDGDDTDFENVADVRRENLPVSGNMAVLKFGD